MTDTSNPWTTLSEKRVYENPWISVFEFEVLNPSGKPGIYGKVHFKNRAVGVVALEEDLQTYLVGQFRFPLDQYSWEIPEGGCPSGESALQCAQRELLEETGLVATRWEPLLTMHLSNSVSDEQALIFLAQQLHQQASSPEETEKLSVRKLPFQTAYQMVLDGQITDSMSVAAILRVQLLLNQGQIKINP